MGHKPKKNIIPLQQQLEILWVSAAIENHKQKERTVRPSSDPDDRINK